MPRTAIRRMGGFGRLAFRGMPVLLTVGQLRGRWLNTESVRRLADHDAKARAAIEGYLAHADPYQLIDHPYYWAAFILLGETAPLDQD